MDKICGENIAVSAVLSVKNTVIQLEFLHLSASHEGVKCLLDGSVHYSPNLP